LLASADYESFYKVMSKHGKLKKASKADAKADAKPVSSSSVAASKKGTDDDDDDRRADSKSTAAAERRSEK
jgi:hypothetical protein